MSLTPPRHASELQAHLSSLLTPLCGDPLPGRLAVACSGGPDSLALTLLLHAIQCQQRAGELTALIVDHGLRAESAVQAQQTADWLRAHSIRCEILPLQAKPAGNLQDWARQQRYRVMTQRCHQLDITHLFCAHHAGDQRETGLFRLLRGSGVAGLAGMSMRRQHDGIALLRPLLRVEKPLLQAYLAERGQPYITDPTNDNPAYSRTKLRHFLARHVSPAQRQRLDALMLAFGRYRHQHERWLQQLCDALVSWPLPGICAVDARMDQLTEAARVVLLSQLLTATDGRATPPRWQEVAQLADRLPCQHGKSVTLHRCQIMRVKDAYWIFRELRHTAPPYELDAAAGEEKWDDRFVVRVCSGHATAPLTIAPLGAEGLATLKARKISFPSCPSAALYSYPAIWQLEALQFVPHLYDDGLRNPENHTEIQFKPSKPLDEGPFFILNEALT